MTGASRSRRGGAAPWSLSTILAVAAIVAGCATAQPTASPSPTAAPTDPGAEWQPTTAWETTLARIGPDGSVDLDTALVAFSLAIAPLPGVTVPPEDPGVIDDGAEAVRWLRSHWDELTDAQRTEAQRHLVPAGQPGAVAGAVAPASRLLPRGAAVADLTRPIGIDAVAGLDAPADRPARAVLDQTIAAIAVHLKRQLTKPGSSEPLPVLLTINPTEESVGGKAALAYALVADENGGAVGAPAECYVWMNPSGMALDDVAFTATLAHEAYHCFQGALEQSLREFEIPTVVNPWVIEGQAEWVGETIAKELSGSSSHIGANWWRPYLLAPKKPLPARSYDAIGFYARIEERGQDPWLVLDSMITTASGLEAYHRATDAISIGFTDSWATGYFRDGGSGPDWGIEKGVALPSGVEPKPALIPLAEGDSYRINVKAYANAIFLLDGPAEVVRFRITGHARLIEATQFEQIGLDGVDFCLKDPCTCPPGMHFTDPPPGVLNAPLKIGVTGATDGALGSIVGSSLLDLCSPDESPRPSGRGGSGANPPCRSRCAMSNGDPHLMTVNGRAYDFQAAGEYTLLRSGDGSVDVQVRQEPYGKSTTVSINTAMALRVIGHRIGIGMATSGTIESRVDGTVTTPEVPVDLGGGASVVAHASGVEIVLPDGSSVWALSLGDYGINILIAPSAATRDSAMGILARAAAGGAGLPMLPEGTSLPRAADRHARYVQLYQTFADAWRVTDATSLFDYAPGTSTATFTKPGFPSEQDQLAQQALPMESVPGAREACAQVTDPDLNAQCVFDVAVTNNLRFANQYALSQRLVKQGSGALSAGQAPAPSASPSSRALPAGVVQIVPAPAVLRGQAISPGGDLYLSVEYPGDRFEVLTIDPRSGTVVGRVAAAGGGQVAFAAGSVWVGEFSGNSAGCSVTRLDPSTLAVQATVATTCTLYSTALAATRDAVWVHDPTGVDADGKGSHLRRIDPASNTLETEVAIPFSYGSLTASESHVFYGDRGHGNFRIADGGTTIEPIDVPDVGASFPAGDGIWTQQPGGPALRFATVGGSSQSIEIEGSLVAADTLAVYAEELGGTGRLWRYPLDGSQRAEIATRGSEGADADLRFGFAGGRLLVGDPGLVGLWQYVSDESTHAVAIAVRWLPLP